MVDKSERSKKYSVRFPPLTPLSNQSETSLRASPAQQFSYIMKFPVKVKVERTMPVKPKKPNRLTLSQKGQLTELPLTFELALGQVAGKDRCSTILLGSVQT